VTFTFDGRLAKPEVENFEPVSSCLFCFLPFHPFGSACDFCFSSDLFIYENVN
jgi:hypothetical protein